MKLKKIRPRTSLPGLWKGCQRSRELAGPGDCAINSGIMGVENDKYTDITGILLAGGIGRRLGGRDKARMEYLGRTFIDRLIGLFGELFPRTLIVTGDPETLADLEVEVIGDEVPGQGAAMGLMTGLSRATTEWSFASACDTPLLKREVVELVLDNISQEFDVILSASPDGLQPLCAAYRRRCADVLRRNLAQGNRSIRPIYDQLKVKIIGPAEILRLDPGRESFININTPRDLEILRRLEADRDR